MAQTCIDCDIKLKRDFVMYKGLKMEALMCPKCKSKVFTEKQTLKAISKLESKRLEQEYKKRPIRIGHSWGMTFPKDIVDVFGIENPDTTLIISPRPEKNKIEISLGK